MYTYIVFEDNNNNAICHYGIKGMKWGVRRYQNKDGSLTELGRKRYMKTKYGMSKASGIFRGNRNDIISEHVYTYTDQIGVAHYKDAVDLKDTRVCSEYVSDPSAAFSKQYSKVNPMYGKQTGTVDNCTKCAAAMILAKKGYDFEAGRSWGGIPDAFNIWFSGAKKMIHDDATSATSEILKSKKGDYGTIQFRNKQNPKSGHVINWEHNSDGTFSLYDSQNSTSFHSELFSECLEQYNNSLENMFDMNSTVTVFDLTNSDPNWDVISEDAVVRFNSEDYTGKNLLYDREYDKFYTEL